MARFCVAVYLLTALLIDASYQLHIALGGRRIDALELASTSFFFSIWLPLIPLIIDLARRYAPVRGRRLRALEVHFFVALALSFVTLVAHKLVFCAGHNYLECVMYYRLEAWMARWFCLDYFLYAAIVAGIWLADAMESTRKRELLASVMERELASAELRLMTSQVSPASLTGMFGAISSRVPSRPAEAEKMVTLVADFLRINVRAIGAVDLTVADDLDLVATWLAMEKERTGAEIRLDVEVDAATRAMPIASVWLQPSIANAMTPDTRHVRITQEGSTVSFSLSVYPSRLARDHPCSSGTEAIPGHHGAPSL